MKVLIVSDTHKANDNYFRVLEKEKPDMVIHCGDSEGSAYALTAAADCPVHIVSGNCDFFSGNLPRELLVEIGPYIAMVVHGHSYFVNAGTYVLKDVARDRGADMVFFGHTHVPVIDDDGEITAVNPGSISYPRQEGRIPSYCVMTINEKNEIDYKIKYIQ